MSKPKLSHAKRPVTYGEIHLHITEAIDALQSRYPYDTEDGLMHRMVITARRILQNRRDGTPVIIKRGMDLVD